MIDNLIYQYEFVIENFTEEKYIEPIMRYYKDFSYVTFIMNLPFIDGFKLYLKCIENIKEDQKEIIKERVFKIWLVDCQRGYKGSFEQYYNNKLRKVEESNLTRKEKISEEKRIHKKVELKKHSKMEEVKFNL